MQLINMDLTVGQFFAEIAYDIKFTFWFLVALAALFIIGYFVYLWWTSPQR